MAVLRAKAKIKVLNDFFLIEPIKEELQVDKRSGLTKAVVESIKGGKLFIPETSEYALKKQPMKGKVVAFGDKVTYKDIKIGDIVYFGYYCYTKIKPQDTEYFEMREYDLLAVERA